MAVPGRDASGAPASDWPMLEIHSTVKVDRPDTGLLALPFGPPGCTTSFMPATGRRKGVGWEGGEGGAQRARGGAQVDS